MPDPKPTITHPTTNPPPCKPSPSSVHWPIGDAIVTCGPTAADARSHAVVIPLTVTLSLAPDVKLSENTTLSLLYVVNGSLDSSTLFSQMEISRHSTITFPAGQSKASFTLQTLPLPPNSTFELEVLAYAAGAGVILSGLSRAEEPKPQVEEDKSLNALSTLATTALVTALGALAFALLRSKD